MFVLSDQEGLKYFHNPVHRILMTKSEDVLPGLKEVESWVEKGYSAMGFLTYEASPGLNPELRVKESSQLLGYWEIHDKISSPQKPSPPFPVRPNSELYLSPLLPTWPQGTYNDAFALVKKALERGDSYQVNLTMGFETKLLGDLSTPGLLDLWLKGWKGSPGPQGYFCEHPQGWILSFSPELFFETTLSPKKGKGLATRRILTRPMKGTRPRGLTPTEDLRLAQDLKNSPKDRAENLMITDMVRNDLGKIALPGTVEVTELFQLESYPTVHQLVSRIQARTTVTNLEVIQELFPSASITGAPKKRTMELISALEDSPRGIYTGSLGYWDKKGLRLNVAIRTLSLTKEGRGTYRAGGGVVWDSKPQEEWEEIQTKTRVLDPLIFPADLIETLKWTPKEGFWLKKGHEERLANSCKVLGFPPPPSDLFDQWRPPQRPEGESTGPLRVRLVWTRLGQALWTVEPLLELPQPLKLGISLRAFPEGKSLFLQHKTTERSLYQETKKSLPQMDEVLLWNSQGMVTEGTFTNLVYRLDGQNWTPPLEDGVLPGVYRQFLLDQKLVSQRSLRITELPLVESFTLVNALRGKMKATLHLPLEGLPGPLDPG